MILNNLQALILYFQFTDLTLKILHTIAHKIFQTQKCRYRGNNDQYNGQPISGLHTSYLENRNDKRTYLFFLFFWFTKTLHFVIFEIIR